ncbi:sigma factor-like helix-turn-helix DNA-binding protein [Actinoplanes sp. TFC3]|uniref:sigma factor-like helix-turn-helix DNA-binding protein n=1 Tax=Actinoplanes sp. TFC3 TaxID=1710355 RepID=UPI00082D568B|nr:sigma factor-like helix-turn-helix DNA-binding protein [Actinoplanes sp. TFC3]
MQVKGIPLPADAESRGADWPSAGGPSAVELAAIEAELEPVPDAVDWQRWADDLTHDVPALVEAVAAFGERVPPSAATVRRWQDLSSTALVELAVAGHLDALDPLFRRFDAQLQRAALRRAENNAPVADEAISATWERCVATVGSWGQRVRTEDDLRRWLFGTLKAEVRRAFAARWREVPAREDWVFEVGTPVATPAEAAQLSEERRDLLARLTEGMAALSHKQRWCLRLQAEGMDAAQVADRTGLSTEQVRKNWTLATMRLRRMLADPLADATAGQLADAARTLPKPLCEVMTLRLQGVSRPEIAARTGLPVSTVHGRLDSARELMRRRMLEPATSGVVDMQAARQRTEARRAQLVAAAEQLPTGQREVALLRIEGLRATEVAQQLGMNRKTVVSSWGRAREKFARVGLDVAADTGLDVTGRGVRPRAA